MGSEKADRTPVRTFLVELFLGLLLMLGVFMAAADADMAAAQGMMSNTVSYIKRELYQRAVQPL